MDYIMITYNENYKNLYKDMIRKGCLIVVDEFEELEDELKYGFRGTGKTTALKELEQEEGYFVLGRNFDSVNSLKDKIEKLSKCTDIKTIKVLIDDDINENFKGINIAGVRVEIIGGFIAKDKMNPDVRCVLARGTTIIDTTIVSNHYIPRSTLHYDVVLEFQRRLTIIRLIKSDVLSKETLDTLETESKEEFKRFIVEFLEYIFCNCIHISLHDKEFRKLFERGKELVQK